MIDEKINKTLTELESNLRNLESARQQVEKTIQSYDGLSSTTSEYVVKLGTVTTKIHELVENIGKDYDNKVKAFEKDRETIIYASNEATEKLSKATDEFNESLSIVQKKLKYSMIVNIVSLITIGAILALLLIK